MRVLQRFLRTISRIIGRNRIIISIAASFFLIYFATPTRRAIFTGVPFILLGEALRTWASGFIRKEKELTTEGPYALTRNPLYLGNFFIGLGFGIMANNSLILALFLTCFSVIYTVTIKNEEKRLLNKFGDAYLAYKEKVPIFFPRLRNIGPMTPPMIAIDWHLVLRHREHHTWLGIAGCIIVFILKLSYQNS